MLYRRVATADQSCDGSERDRAAIAARAGEIASGVRLDRAERRGVLALAQRREIDAVWVTELSRWGRSTTDLLATLHEVAGSRVSLVALNGLLGRQPGQRPQSDRLAPKVLARVAQGSSYRLVGREVGPSMNTVAEIVRRDRAGRERT